MANPCRERRDTYLIDRMIAGCATRSDGGTYNSDHRGVCTLCSLATQSIPRIYRAAAMLVAHSTSSLANHAGIVVVIRRHLGFYEPEKKALQEMQSIGTQDAVLSC